MLKRICVGLLICLLSNGARALAAAPLTDDDSIRSMHASALQSSARGDIDSALTTFDSAIRLAERTYGKDSSYVADLCYDAGVAALHENRWTKAQDFLSKAVQINPNSKQARIELAAYYHKRGQCADAKQQLQKVLAHDPTNLEARHLMALTYQKEGNPGKAASELYKLQAAAAGQPVAAESEPAPETQPAVTAMLPPTPPVPHPEAAATTNPLASLLHNIAPQKPAEKPAPKPIKPKERTLSKKQLQAQRRAEQKAEAQRKAAEQRKAAAARKAAQKKHAAPPQDESVSAFNTPARLHSKAVLLTPVNKHAASSESSAAEAPAPEPKKPAHVVEQRDDSGPEEEGFGGVPIRKARKQAPAPVATPPVQPMVPVVPKIEAPKRPRGGLVPPPPPVVPQFGIPAFMPPPPQPKPIAQPVAKKPVVREVIDDNAKPTDEDAEFLLDWAGKKKKKK